MKKTLILILVILSVITCYGAAETQFSSDPDSIEEKAQSVLMLEIYDSNDELIATGSGFIAFNNRTIVTNFHVIEDADIIIAYSDAGYQYIITKVLIADETKDIAICSFMSPTDLTPLELNTEGDLKRGESVVAIGSPIGITNTVSLGNISAMYEDDSVYWIQFTAPISEGSSGGALFDNNGKVIGITSASYIDTQNLNLAIHISEVTKLYDTWDGTEKYFDEYFDVIYATPSPAPTNTPQPTESNPPLNSEKSRQELIIVDYFDTNAEGDSPDFTPSPTPTETGSFDVDTARQRVIDLGYFGDKYVALREGDKGDRVKALQQRLIDLGYLEGTADGVYGPKTAEAVLLFNEQNGIYTPYASNITQYLLFEGNPKKYSDPDMSLYFNDGAYVQCEFVSGDKLKIHFEVTNKARKKSVTAFELYVYATDVWGNEIYGDYYYYFTTTKTVSPGQTVYSDYVTIPERSDIYYVYCGIHKVAYSDGTVYELPEHLIEYGQWTIN